MAIDVREYWNFDDPGASEHIFRDLIAKGSLSADDRLEVWAQVARTFSLRRDCITCHLILDEHWDAAMNAGGRPRASFQLERGRAYRTGNDLEDARPYFQDAASQSTKDLAGNEIDDLKIDALHMLAIDADSETAYRIHVEALEFAQASPNPMAQRWQGTLYNNMAWSFFADAKYENALNCFEQALAQREKYGVAWQIRVAKWCIGRCQRALGNLDQALEIQTALLVLDASGFVYEELGELLLAQGKPDEAKPHFRKAVEMLESDLGADSDRIIRLKNLIADS